MKRNQNFQPLFVTEPTERRLRDALLQITVPMKRQTQRTYDLRRAETGRCRFVASLLAHHLDAKDAGVGKYELLTFCRELEATVVSWFPTPTYSVPDAIVNETLAECVLNPMQSRVLRNPNDHGLLRDIELPIIKHRDSLNSLLESVGHVVRGTAPKLVVR